VQVLTAIATARARALLSQLGDTMKPLGDAFIKMIKMIIAPIIFCTVVTHRERCADMKKVGRVGLNGAGLLRGADDDRLSSVSSS